ncbi:hypothetical protein [Caudoviricetes sp.]|nr:hypothetical protein [Caudoviricetes sp.]
MSNRLIFKQKKLGRVPRNPKNFKWVVMWPFEYDAAQIVVVDYVDGFYCWRYVHWPHYNNVAYVKLVLEEMQLALMYDVK